MGVVAWDDAYDDLVEPLFWMDSSNHRNRIWSNHNNGGSRANQQSQAVSNLGCIDTDIFFNGVDGFGRIPHRVSFRDSWRHPRNHMENADGEADLWQSELRRGGLDDSLEEM